MIRIPPIKSYINTLLILWTLFDIAWLIKEIVAVFVGANELLFKDNFHIICLYFIGEDYTVSIDC